MYIKKDVMARSHIFHVKDTSKIIEMDNENPKLGYIFIIIQIYNNIII